MGRTAPHDFLEHLEFQPSPAHRALHSRRFGKCPSRAYLCDGRVNPGIRHRSNCREGFPVVSAPNIEASRTPLLLVGRETR